MKQPWLIVLGLAGMVVWDHLTPKAVVVQPPAVQPVAVQPVAVQPAADERQQFRQVQEARIDVNHASVQELEALVGVGPAIAAEIVAYRDAHGPFQKAEDLLPVRGIGPKKLMAMSPQLLFK